MEEMTAGVCDPPLLLSDGCGDGQQMMAAEPAVPAPGSRSANVAQQNHKNWGFTPMQIQNKDPDSNKQSPSPCPLRGPSQSEMRCPLISGTCTLINQLQEDLESPTGRFLH